MQQKFEASLLAGFTIPENTEQLKTALNHLFDPQGAGLPALSSALQYENKPKFGPSAIGNVRFEVVTYQPNNQKGRLRIWYDMQLSFSCEDAVKTHHNQHSYYNFHFNPTQLLIILESDTPDQPSTADEF